MSLTFILSQAYGSWQGFIFFSKDWIFSTYSDYIDKIEYWFHTNTDASRLEPQGQTMIELYFLYMPSSLISTVIVDIHQIHGNSSWTNGHCLLLLLSLIGLNIKGSLL